MSSHVSSILRSSFSQTILKTRTSPIVLPRFYATMAIKTNKISVHKFQPPKGSDIDFGAEIRGANLENISSKSCDNIFWIYSSTNDNLSR